MKVLALDFGGSSVKYGIVDDNAKIEESGKVPAPNILRREYMNAFMMILRLSEKCLRLGRTTRLVKK